MNNEISIIVFANAKDFFLTKICVASIRYFYPEVEIFIVKDELNGKFNTLILEKNFNVKELKLSAKYFGWGGAKLHFLIEIDQDKSFLFLDSDIIFIGRVLDKLKESDSDFIVSSEFYEWSDIVKRVFIDPDKVLNYYPSYRFPGFFFNTGQILVNPSKIKLEDFRGVFDPFLYPYHLDRKTFQFVDQSILNGLLPSLATEKRITFEGIEFMKSSADFFTEANNKNATDILNLESKFLIHWAGDIRVPKISKMRGYEILKYFQLEYKARLTMIQKIQNNFQDIINDIKLLLIIKVKKNRLIIEINQRWLHSR